MGARRPGRAQRAIRNKEQTKRPPELCSYAIDVPSEDHSGIVQGLFPKYCLSCARTSYATATLNTSKIEIITNDDEALSLIVPHP